MADLYHVVTRHADAETHFLPVGSNYTFCGHNDVETLYIAERETQPRVTCGVCVSGRKSRHPGWSQPGRTQHPHYLKQISTPEGLLAVYEKYVKRGGRG